jgi:hypothetical protein
LTVLRSFALVCLLLSPAALAKGEDDPIPYSDDPQDRASKGKPRRAPQKDPDYDVEDRSRELYRDDDPHLGLGAELLGGLMLIDSSRGQLVESRFGWGLRGVWEIGRLFNSETLRDALFTDITWSYSALKEGTTLINATAHLHYFSVAPAWLFTFGEVKNLGLYLQLGGGASLMSSSLNANGSNLSVVGFKPLLQYGAGFRAATVLSDDGTARLTFRVEFTRFRRGYMDDTFIGASTGAAF